MKNMQGIIESIKFIDNIIFNTYKKMYVLMCIFLGNVSLTSMLLNTSTLYWKQILISSKSMPDRWVIREEQWKCSIQLTLDRNKTNPLLNTKVFWELAPFNIRVCCLRQIQCSVFHLWHKSLPTPSDNINIMHVCAPFVNVTLVWMPLYLS